MKSITNALNTGDKTAPNKPLNASGGSVFCDLPGVAKVH
jgi:hypothetical protein